jgi:hypothetical protein
MKGHTDDKENNFRVIFSQLGVQHGTSRQHAGLGPMQAGSRSVLRSL